MSEQLTANPSLAIALLLLAGCGSPPPLTRSEYNKLVEDCRARGGTPLVWIDNTALLWKTPTGAAYKVSCSGWVADDLKVEQ